MAHVISAESAREEHERYAALSPGGKMEAMSELLSDKQSEDRAKQSPHKRHEPTPRERDRDRSTSATPLLTPSVTSAADQGIISPLSINNPLVHRDDPPPQSLAVDMGMNQDTLHRQQREGGTPEYLRFQKGPNVGYEARKEKERIAEQQQQQQQLHPSAMPRHSLSPQQSWESEMYADAGETDNECILSGSDASVPLFSISTEGTIFSQEDGTPTQLTPQQSRDADVMTASLKCISPEIRQQLQDDFVVDRKLMRLLTQPFGETSGIPGGDTHLTEDTRAQMRIDVWNTICSSKPNGDLLHLKLMAPGRSREDLINRGNKCMEEIIIHDTDPTADGFSQLVSGEDSPLLTEPMPAVPSEVWRRMLQQVKVKDSADYGMKYRLVDLQRMHRRGQQKESEKTKYQVIEMPASMLSAGYSKRDEYLGFLPEEAYDLMRKNQRMVRKGKREEEVDWRAYVARQSGCAIGVCVTGTQERRIPVVFTHVAEQHRGKGVGRCLIREVQQRVPGRGVLSVELQHCINEARSFYCQQAHFRVTDHVNDKDGACCLHWERSDGLAPPQEEGSAPEAAGDSPQDTQQAEMYDPAEPTSPVRDRSLTAKQPRRSPIQVAVDVVSASVTAVTSIAAGIGLGGSHQQESSHTTAQQQQPLTKRQCTDGNDQTDSQ